MGCDIHCYVEKKDENGKWNGINGFVSDYYDESSDYFSGDRFSNASSPIDCRNYDTFAWLANVRNRGYITPICDPRGLPSDVSESIRGEAEKWGYDGHSHSWLTLKELVEALPLYTAERAGQGWGSETTVQSIGQLSERSDSDDLQDIRIVFWFDN